MRWAKLNEAKSITGQTMVTVRKSYGRRVKNAIVGTIVGAVLFIGSFFLLSWNEYDAVRQTGAITEINKVALADVPSESVNDANDGQLVHMASNAKTDDVLEYPTFGISENAVRLRWDTSIYQWEEDRREKDDRTVYEYDREWVDQPIDSSNFKDPRRSNEGSEKHFQDDSVQAELVHFGAFRLSKRLIEQIDNEKKYALPDSIAMDVRPQGAVRDGVFYTGDPNNPQIGDERVEVFIVGPQHDVTVMARQAADTFAAFETKVGIDKEILYSGLLTKSQVIGKQRTEAAVKRWLLRGLGFACMWIGLGLAFSPIRAIASFIPFAGRLVGGAVFAASFVIALALSSVVVAVAWFAVRPLLSVGLLVLAAACIAYLMSRKVTDVPEQQVSRATPPPLPTS